MNQNQNRRSASAAAIRLLVSVLLMLVVTNSATQLLLCQGLFLDVTKIGEPEGNEARARLGKSGGLGDSVPTLLCCLSHCVYRLFNSRVKVVRIATG